MKIVKPNKYLFITAILFAPLSFAYLSHSFFENSSSQIYSKISVEEGTVAGASNTSIKNITDRFPIIPGAEIVSVDTSNENTFVTLEADKTEEEIKKFYSENKIQNDVEVSISGNIIKVTLKD